MKNFGDLSAGQQEALTDAFGSPENYKQPSLVEVDDPVDAAEYNTFRNHMEGQKVSQGNLDEEELQSYKKRGFLNEEENGDLEINSIWDKWQVEAMEDNDMYDFTEVDMFVTKDSQTPEVMALGVGEKAVVSIEDSMTYRVLDVDSKVSAEYESSRKIEEITRDFIEFFTGEGSRDTGFMNTRSKPERGTKGGDNNMTEDYDSLEGVHEAVLSGDIQDVDQTAELIEEYSSDDPTMSEAYLIASTMEYQALQAGDDVDAVEVYQDALDRVEDAGAAAKHAVVATANNAWNQINAMEETEEGVREAYITHMLDNAESLEEIAERDQELAENVSEKNERLESIADELEDVSPRSFRSDTHEEVTAELEELRDVSGLSEGE